MKIVPQTPSLFHDEVEIDVNGPSMLEIREAISLICCKYGGEVGLLVSLEEGTRKDVQGFFLEKKVNVTFRDTLHPHMCVALCNGVAR